MTAAARTILVVGGSGQIGHELVRELVGLGRVVAPTRHDLDLTVPASLRDAIRRIRPNVVVNAAGYTGVDRAESEPGLCGMLNTDAPALLAEECKRLGAAFVHYSTDYVFDGTKATPYVETDPPAPLSVYGRTKLAGEEGVVAAGGEYVILRTSWVYSARGVNFPRAILRLAREREEVTVVNDQIGAPTSAAAIAAGTREVLCAMTRSDSGVYHMTASGTATWYEFARLILADDPRVAVRPIATADFPTAARRPAYSVLDNAKIIARFGVRLAPWREQWLTSPGPHEEAGSPRADRPTA